MFVPFSSISPQSRIWIFQANRPIAADELKIIEGNLQAFTEGWTAHGEPLKTSFTVKFGQFIVLAADENHHRASGCSIDSSVRVLKEIQQSIGLKLFERDQVAFKIEEQIVLIPIQQLKQKFDDGILNEQTLTFNNLLSTKSQFEQDWITPAGKTWLKRYMPDELVKLK
jgi:hypothetical protein